MPSHDKTPPWQTILAFATIYLVWGSTFLAIRIGVQAAPPLLFAAMRFVVAGALLFGWTLLRRESRPTAKQWRSIFILAVLIFLIDYGLVFWAEQRIASGIAAVIMATIPAFTALFEILILKTQRLTARLAIALTIGLAGVAILMSHAFNLGDAPVDTPGAIALIIGSITWSLASVLSRRLPLPESKFVSSGAQMLVGGILLTLAAAAHHEFRGFAFSSVSRAGWLALIYLIILGSLIAFTVYVWLIHHQSPTKVGTYAYVNPVVAVVLGYFFAAEPVGLRTLLGAACVLIGVIIITTRRTPTPSKA